MPSADGIERAGYIVGLGLVAIGLANATWRVLGPLTVMLRQEGKALELRAARLCLLVYAHAERQHAAETLFLDLPEPITESEHAQRMVEARAEYLPIDEAVELVADHQELAWEREAELERIETELAKELRAAAKERTLVSKGRGRSLSVQAGSLYEWLGYPVPVYGELGLHLGVVPDERAEQVAAQREARERTGGAPHHAGGRPRASRAGARGLRLPACTPGGAGGGVLGYRRGVRG